MPGLKGPAEGCTVRTRNADRRLAASYGSKPRGDTGCWGGKAGTQAGWTLRGIPTERQTAGNSLTGGQARKEHNSSLGVRLTYFFTMFTFGKCSAGSPCYVHNEEKMAHDKLSGCYYIWRSCNRQELAVDTWWVHIRKKP